MAEELYKRLVNIKHKTPILLLGKAAEIFKINYSSDIITPITFDFEEYVNTYDYDQDKLIVLNLLSYSLETSCLNMFLSKLKTPVILLSEDTQINYKQLSNIKTIIKYSDISKSKLTNANEALNIWKEYDNKSNISKFYAEESPELYYLRSKSTMNKYVELLSKC